MVVWVESFVYEEEPGSAASGGVAQFARDGAVIADGAITDPAAVVAAVQNQPTRLQAFGAAISDGAKDAILSTVQGGVAAMVVALLGG